MTRDYPVAADFYFEAYSLAPEMYPEAPYKEGLMRKQNGDYVKANGVWFGCNVICREWIGVWFRINKSLYEMKWWLREVKCDLLEEESGLHGNGMSKAPVEELFAWGKYGLHKEKSGLHGMK